MKINKTSEEKMLGGNPKGKTLITTMSILEAFNFYNYFFDAEDSANFINEYAAKNNMNVKVKKHDLPMNVGWIARMLLDSCTLDVSLVSYFNRKISEFKKIEVKEVVSVVKPHISTHRDNIHIQYIENVIDEILKGNNVDFDFNAYSQKNSLSSIAIKTIRDYYSGNLQQLQDPANKEYFSHDKKIIKRLIEFYSNLEDGVSIQIIAKKRTRKPRKKKIQTTDKILSLIKLQQDSKDLKITTLPKEKILESDFLVLYNTRYKKITLLYAEQGKKFTVHRTAIQNIDTKKSFQCILRKPEIRIHDFTTGTQAAIRKVFDGLTTTKNEVDSYYTNENVMIIRAFRA